MGTDLRDAARQALEAWQDQQGMKRLCEAMDALGIALEHLEQATGKESLQVEPEQAEVLAWMYVDAHEPRNRHLEWTEDRKGYRGDWIKTPLVAAPVPRQSSDAATPCRPGAPASRAGPG
jgi:hypothetical protein